MGNGSRDNPTPTMLPHSNNLSPSFSPRIPKDQKRHGRVVDSFAEITTVLVSEFVQAIRTGKRSDNEFKMNI